MFLLFAFGAVFLGPGQRSFSAEPLVVGRHQITVIDGDSIQIGDTVYQLAGIDAPELGQACGLGEHLWLCGLAAGYRLRKLIELQVMPIRCFVRPRDGATPMAVCMAGDRELSDILLTSGYAVALEDGQPHYAASEHHAKLGDLGIWGGTFVPPWEWRRGRRLPNEHRFAGSSHPRGTFPWKPLETAFLRDSKAEHAACMVKGTVSADNQRLYFGPLDEGFGSIVVDPQRGGRFFCGDDEARKAGWRRKGERR